MRGTLADRLWIKIDRSGGPQACWPWLAALDKDGYGVFWDGRRQRKAHTVVYETTGHQFPVGLVPDHKCRRRSCCNWMHIEPVTVRVNVLRGRSNAAVNATKTHCKHGHEFTTRNTYVRPDGLRDCHTCRTVRHREQTRKRASTKRLSAENRQ